MPSCGGRPASEEYAIETGTAYAASVTPATTSNFSHPGRYCNHHGRSGPCDGASERSTEAVTSGPDRCGRLQVRRAFGSSNCEARLIDVTRSERFAGGNLCSWRRMI